MTIRFRYLALTFFFAFCAVAASGDKSAIGIIVSGVVALIFLGVGIWDSGREDRYYFKDEDKDDAAP